MDKIDTYLTKIRDVLAQSSPNEDSQTYLDLAAVEKLTSPGDLLLSVPPGDGLMGFQEIMMAEIARCNSDKIKIGINELLKHLLVTIDKNTEQYLAERHLYRLRMIFKRCLIPSFPFPEEIWNYICDCLRNTGSFLVEREYYTASREVIDSLTAMGRTAALKGLPTATTQSALRSIENTALQKNERKLASIAKNARFNLET